MSEKLGLGAAGVEAPVPPLHGATTPVGVSGSVSAISSSSQPLPPPSASAAA